MIRRTARGPSDDGREEVLKLANAIGKLLARAALALLILMLLSQLALQNEMIRGFVTSADRWEGTRLN
ncbi:hypothetical protein [Paenibacillus soyae]|uniref:Uncharacterized protein n=1 Tax=Paenibacillus soyae TaxID=2969249 RepID=A0A9X2MJL4_9BACL|nr:hypothetical protein [Paenibacillus soyae]MCR2803038.1 hypothetical protein [Paenibacillus soyae]